jgi:hypothetical protein
VGSAHISFSFPPPHDDYSGEVRSATGWLEIDAQGGMAGVLSVRAAEVDMGDPDLTQNVRYAAEMLYAEAFPNISFQFASLRPYSGSKEGMTLRGTFKLKSVEVTLNASAQMELSPAEAGKRMLHLHGSFELTDLGPRFQVAGPGGKDDAAGNTMQFTFDFRMVPEL